MHYLSMIQKNRTSVRFHQDDTNCRLYTWSSRPSAAFNFSVTSKKVKSEDPYRSIKIFTIFLYKTWTNWTGFKPTIVAIQPQNYLILHFGKVFVLFTSQLLCGMLLFGSTIAPYTLHSLTRFFLIIPFFLNNKFSQCLFSLGARKELPKCLNCKAGHKDVNSLTVTVDS